MALILFVTLTGCGSSNLIVPTTLPGLNDELDGRKARIVLTDGRVIDEVRDVYVHEDLTTYREDKGSDLFTEFSVPALTPSPTCSSETP